MVTTLVIKIILLFFLNDNLSMNPDEERNFIIAQNHLNGSGYTIFNPEKQVYEPTAFHGSFSVFVYESLIKLNIKKEFWVIFSLICYLILFGISIFCFYKLSLIFLLNDKYALWATITYCFYPSTLIYLGSTISYENFSLSLLVIIIYKLIRSYRQGIIKSDYIIIPVAVSLSCLFRPNIIAVYTFLFLAYVLIVLNHKKFQNTLMVLIVVLFTAVSHLSSLQKNKKLFGSYILSTESGFAFLLGHNPTARGGWAGDWQQSGSSYSAFVHSKIANYESLNEYEKSVASEKLATKWIIHNPLIDLKLELRKLAIYFLPQNFSAIKTWNWYNPINLVTHILFLCMIFFKLFKLKFTVDDWMMLIPVIASIAICILFFSGYRWRYYAEPFMIIYAWQFIGHLQYRKLVEINTIIK